MNQLDKLQNKWYSSKTTNYFRFEKIEGLKYKLFVYNGENEVN